MPDPGVSLSGTLSAPAARVLEVITARPGLNLVEIAPIAGVTVEQMYVRVLPELMKANLISKDWYCRRWYLHPAPGCVCPPSYVRDTCGGHTEPGCPFKGLFGRELADTVQNARDHHAAFGQETHR